MLTAGLGTRLRPLTDRRAKPAMPVAGEPLVRRTLSWLVRHGVRDVVMNLHHRPETISSVVGDGSDLDARVRYSWEQPRVLGSAGGPRQALSIVGADTFFLINGDTLTDADAAAVAAAHVASGALVTLALVPNREFLRYGGVVVDGGGAVTGFVKRGPDSAGSWHFVGIQVVEGSVFASLQPGVPAASIGGVYDGLIRTRPGSVRAFCGDFAFWDVGTAADYLQTSLAFSESGVDIGRGARIDPSARLDRSVLWDDVEVGEGTTLTECIVADGVRVPAGASYQRTILIQRGGALEALPLES